MEKTGTPREMLLILLISTKLALGRWLRLLGRKVSVLRPRPVTEGTRGDVPGWVLITLMSAVLVAGLLAIAGPALEKLFNEAMDQVHP